MTRGGGIDTRGARPSGPVDGPGGRGPLRMVGAAATFTLMVVFVKQAAPHFSIVELVFWRGLVSIPVSAALAVRTGFAIRRKGLLGVRTGLGFLAMSAYYAAAKGLVVADLALVGRLQPLVIAMVAPLLLGRGERAGSGTWWVLLAGLLGCGILLGPQLEVGNEAGWFALAAVGFSSLAHLSLRRLGATETPDAAVFWFQVGIMALSGVTSLLWPGLEPQVPTWSELPPLAGIGACAAAAQLLMTRAYQAARAPRVAAASHVQPVWGGLADLVFFGLLPSLNTWVGGAIVMAAVGWLVWRTPATPDTDSHAR